MSHFHVTCSGWVWRASVWPHTVVIIYFQLLYTMMRSSPAYLRIQIDKGVCNLNWNSVWYLCVLALVHMKWHWLSRFTLKQRNRARKRHAAQGEVLAPAAPSPSHLVTARAPPGCRCSHPTCSHRKQRNAARPLSPGAPTSPCSATRRSPSQHVRTRPGDASPLKKPWH
jgi:hypothetical protein